MVLIAKREHLLLEEHALDARDIEQEERKVFFSLTLERISTNFRNAHGYVANSPSLN